ncbi:hypothetical protein B6V75_00660 [Thioclava sp. F1Mire-8]|uniref:AAA family ATPase n=1 Tax=Thioclava sp. F1Mire-8 TaxID=1973006 RepID=UPI000B53D61C|nr:AAA family ATPase [Thioclava sp. F1Mire-8]OWY04698.1 hypothetical protein B6V75_00660 [Thioclava sp. F1Mire-8]
MQTKHNSKAPKGQVSDNRQAAHDLAAEGYFVIPLGANKRPLVKGWQDKATSDARQIERWWAKWPDAMPGLPTGKLNGFVALDVDLKNGKDGFAGLSALGLDVDTLSPGQTFTPTGGRHLHFKYQGEGNSAAGLPAGLDVRGEGGFVVAPGATNGKGVYTGRLTRELPEWPEALTIRRKVVEPGQGEPTGLPFRVIRDALMKCPNDGDAYASRDAWLHMVMAVHCETGGSEEGRELVHEWSKQHHDYDADHTDALWDSCKADRGLTGWHVIHEAERHGWYDDTVTDLRHMELLEDFDDLWDEMGWLLPEEEAEIAELVGVLPEQQTEPLFLPASEWAGLPIPPRKWHVDGLIPGNTVTLLGGDGGTGKSLLALQLAVSTVTGRRWVNRGIDQPGKALVLSAEDDNNELHRRLSDICDSNDVPLAALNKLLMRSLAGEDALLAVLDRKTNALKPTALYAEICRTMERERPKLIILDTLADLHAGNENDRAHGRQFIGMLRHLAIEYECAVVLLAHPSLTGLNSGTGASGSTAWSNSVRSRLYLRRVKDDGYEADPDARILETMKANYGRTGEEIGLTWMGGVFVPDAPTREERNSKAERVFLSLLAEHTKQGRKVSPKASSAYAPKVFAGLPGSEGVSKRAFQAAMEQLLSNGAIRVEEEGPPSKRRAFLVGDS